MRDFLARAAALQAQRDGGEFVGGFLGDRRAGLGRPQLFGIEKYRVENIEVFWLGEFVERKFVGFRDCVGPGRANEETVGVAGDLQRRVFERRRVAHQLGQRVVEIAFLLLVFPGEKALLPDVGKAVAAAGLGYAFFEGE